MSSKLITEDVLGKNDTTEFNSVRYLIDNHRFIAYSITGKCGAAQKEVMENIVYNELLARGYLVDVGIVEVNRKNAEGKSIRKQLEVDFVTNMGNQRYYIQVAYDLSTEEKQKQEFNSFRNIPDSFKKNILVNGSSKPWRNEDGYVIMGMKYFLLNENSLEY